MINKKNKYQHNDPFIAESLNEYKDKIDKLKITKTSISNYKIEKPWGYELWLELNEFYVYKLIHFNAGNKGSLQSHEFKFETVFVIDGEAEFLLENENGIMESNIYTAGQGWSVPVNRKHRVISNKDFTLLEVSTPYLNDVIRHEDDYNRNSGKLTVEHEL